MSTCRIKEWYKSFKSRSSPDESTGLTYNRPFNIKELNQAIKKQRQRGSPGSDGMLVTFIRRSKVLAPLWLAIFNNSFAWGTRDASRKEAVITLIPKGKPIVKPTDARTISLLQVSTKIEDLLVESRLRLAIPKSARPKFQFAFEQDSGCADALESIVQAVGKEKLVNKRGTAIVALDARKAYSKTWHQGLVYKLATKYGLKGNLLNFISSFLDERTARFRVEGCLSRVIKLKAGVPEGSPLSCFLFTTFFDVTSVIKRCKSALYCDDITLISELGGDAREGKIQEDLLEVERWARRWRVKLAPEKSGYLLVGSKKVRNRSLNLNINGIKLARGLIHEGARRMYGKILGLIIDEEWTFKQHAREVLKKANKRLAALKYLSGSRRNLTHEARRNLLTSWVCGPTRYMAHIWRTRDYAEIRRVDNFENRALKIAFNLPSSTESVAAYAIMGILPPKHRTAKEVTKRNILKSRHKPVGFDNAWKYDNLTATREAHVEMNVRHGVVLSNKVTLACRSLKQAEVLQIPHYNDDFPTFQAESLGHSFLESPELPSAGTDKEVWWTNLIRSIPSKSTIVMTDGSYDGSPVAGAGMIILWPSGLKTTHRAPASFDESNAFKGELGAIKMAANVLAAVNPRHLGNEIHLISDSQAALLSVVKGTPKTKTIRQIQRTFEPLKQLNGGRDTLKFHFAYGHINEQHDQADKCAKLAVTEGTKAIEEHRENECSKIAHIPPSFTDKIRTISRECQANWEREWRSEEGQRSTKRMKQLGFRPSVRHIFYGLEDVNHNAIITTWNRVILNVGNINYFLKSRRLVRSNKCRRRGCNGIEDADHILFNCHNIEHANHQQRFKNNIKANFQIPPGVQLLSLKDVLSAMSDAEEYNIGNLFQLAKLIHNFISLHHDSGAI